MMVRLLMYHTGMCIKGPENWWIAKSITPQLVENQSKINPPTFRSFDFYIPIWPSNKITITDFTIYTWSTIWHWSIRQFWHNKVFLVNLLLYPIGMLIQWLEKSWITNLKLLTWVSTIQNSAFGMVLDCRNQKGLFNLSPACIVDGDF